MHEISMNCIKAELTNCTCSECHEWSNGTHCCTLGTRWVNNKCVDNKPLCAI